MGTERLQKLLARRGVASRREAERWILDGRVRVNGEVVRELGTKVDPQTDRVEVDGAPLPRQPRRVTVVLNKPAGYVTTLRDPHAERTVADLVADLDERVYPVGRLDRDTRGVLLLTNDGELAQALLHPSRAVEKVYLVTATGNIPQRKLDRLAKGIVLDDGPTAPARVWGVSRSEGQTRFKIALKEGRKRQIRRMVRVLGGRVVDLVRVSFAGVTAGGLPEGRWRELSAREVELLRSRAAGTHPQARRRGRRPYREKRMRP
ncbi:MAG: pseudouridine synthase [Deferrisomatales bacterium]